MSVIISHLQKLVGAVLLWIGFRGIQPYQDTFVRRPYVRIGALVYMPSTFESRVNGVKEVIVLHLCTVGIQFIK